jgi:hypothetical protein
LCFACRFIKNNLLVELTSSKYASAFAWLLRRHTILSYCLYMAGERQLELGHKIAVNLAMNLAMNLALNLG